MTGLTRDEAAVREAGFRFTEIGPVELKGIGGQVHLHSASRR